MSYPLEVVLLVAASARLTRLVYADSITKTARLWVWKRWHPTTTWPGRLLDCPWCISVWASGVVVATAAVTVGCAAPLLTFAAVAEAAGLILVRVDA